MCDLGYFKRVSPRQSWGRAPLRARRRDVICTVASLRHVHTSSSSGLFRAARVRPGLGFWPGWCSRGKAVLESWFMCSTRIKIPKASAQHTRYCTAQTVQSTPCKTKPPSPVLLRWHLWNSSPLNSLCFSAMPQTSALWFIHSPKPSRSFNCTRSGDNLKFQAQRKGFFQPALYLRKGETLLQTTPQLIKQELSVF